MSDYGLLGEGNDDGVPSDVVSVGIDFVGKLPLVDAAVKELSKRAPGEVPNEIVDDHYARRDASARADKLVREARTRAEHQLAARSTMLDLMEALQVMTQQRRDLERLLALEKGKLPTLQARIKDLEEQLEEALLEDEKRRAAELRQKAIAHGNNFIFNMLLTKSREGFKSRFAGASDNDDAGTDPGSAGPGSAGPGSAIVESSDKPRPSSLLDLVDASTGDRVTVKWAMTLWHIEAEKLAAIKRSGEEEAARLREEAERLRVLEQAREEGRAEVRKEVLEMEKKLKLERDKVKELEAKMKDLRIQNERLRKQLEQRSPEVRPTSAKEERDEPPVRPDDTSSTAGSEPMIVASVTDNGLLEEELRRRQLEYERERRKLHEKIRALQEDLLQAHHLAKNLREMALRAKREAANGISPARLADLLMALETMRERLSVLERETREQRERNESLKRQMDANKRHMELERQFLPLLRQAHGPLGRNDAVKSVKDLKDPPWAVEEQHQQTGSVLARKLPKMGSSYSAGTLAGNGGHLL